MAIVIGAHVAGGGRQIPLGTRKGTQIPNETRRERSPLALQASADLWEEQRPGAQLRSLTAVYNCIGLVFASRRTWVDTSEVEWILQEDEYREVRNDAEAQSGDLVIYRSPRDGDVTHAAVIVRVDHDIEKAARHIYVLSKWGADGEYLHRTEDVPELLGKPVEFWTDRKGER